MTVAREVAVGEAPSEELFGRMPWDEAARNTLIRQNRPLAARIAARYAGHGEELEDLIQVAMIGLIKAVDRFDPSRGVRFSTYAGATVTGEIKRHFRDGTWSLSVPRGAKEAALRTRSALEDMAQSLGRNPTMEEVAARSNLTEAKVREGLDALASYNPSSLDVALDDGDPVGRSREPADDDEGMDQAEEWAELGPYLRRLSQRERRILALRYQEDLTQTEIGRHEGMSQMHVSRILRHVEGELREAVGTR